VDLGGGDAGTLREWADTNCVCENAESWGVAVHARAGAARAPAAQAAPGHLNDQG